MNDADLGTAMPGIAVVGIVGRFPGADNVDELWELLRNGVDPVVEFSDEELAAAGVPPSMINHPDYVKSGTILEGAEEFDAAFFGYSPREAEVMDPQQRLFLQSCWEVLESCGCDPEAFDGLIGVYGGSSMNSYLHNNIVSNPEVAATVGGYQVMISNDKDFLATRVSYKLNLKGPSVVVQSACSTGLVAINMACDSLVDYRCDLAIAGGVSLGFPQEIGYLYQPGMILSPDGHCRPFDKRAGGTIPGKGVAVVALRRLEDAVASGDPILAVIKGWAVNNDGSLKVGYTAPSVEGQAAAVAEAMAMAKFSPDSMGYVETHGTGTALGDPIEISALRLAYDGGTARRGYCALGSLKSNIGHLDAAAGAAGLIKAVLTLQRREIPPLLNFEEPNPQIDFENSPFYVNTKLRTWDASEGPRRAAVSSFGIGGTNAHAVLEEAPEIEPSGPGRPWTLLTLSAKSASALDRVAENLADHLARSPETSLADLGYTLKTGRTRLDHRRTLVVDDVDSAVEALRTPRSRGGHQAVDQAQNRACAFLLTGQGSQYARMGKGLYDTEPEFRRTVDDCAAALEPALGVDLRKVLYELEEGEASARLAETWLTQPALFTVEYAMARLWMAWGIQPDAMLGHSIGEYVAACLSGVFTLDDALDLVVARGRLMQDLPSGSMLAVPLGEAELDSLLPSDVSVAALNAPSMSVASGTHDAIGELERRLAEQDIECRPLKTSHAFHSAMMDPILDAFADHVASLSLGEPRIPFVSNVTGEWIRPQQARDPQYWADHIRSPVRFSSGMATLLEGSDRVLLEVGPGNTLASLARQQPAANGRAIFASIRHPRDESPDSMHLQATLGRLWASGVEVDWSAHYAHERRLRLPLPTYPFEAKRFYLEPSVEARGAAAPETGPIVKRPAVDDWFYYPSWRRTPRPGRPRTASADGGWLVFDEGSLLGEELVASLAEQGADVVRVAPGERFEQVSPVAYSIRRNAPEDYEALMDELLRQGRSPRRIIHLWSLAAGEDGPDGFWCAQERCLLSVLRLVRAVHARPRIGSVDLVVGATALHEVTDGDVVNPTLSPILGLSSVVPQEFPEVRSSVVDVGPPPGDRAAAREIAVALANEVCGAEREPVVAYRGRHRWARTYDPTPRESNGRGSLLKRGGTYLITGGLGGVGLAVAERLVSSWNARVALVGRSGLPDRGAWSGILEATPDLPVARKVRRIRRLEDEGGEVLVLAADVTDREGLGKAFQATTERFGSIDGVIHAAGVVGGETFKGVHELGRDDFEAQFAPKVFGTLAIDDVLSGYDVDFCLATSSISCVLGGLGYGAYAAANQFLDSFVESRSRCGGPRWITGNWDAWAFGTAGDPQAALAMNPGEGAETVERILTAPLEARLVISTGDLGARLELWQGGGGPRGQAVDGPSDGAGLGANGPIDTSDVEGAVLRIWEDLLGVQGLGPDDEFLAVGGNSLLAVQVASRIRQIFEINIPIQTLFDAPTAGQLAERVRTALWMIENQADTSEGDDDEREEVVF